VAFTNQKGSGRRGLGSPLLFAEEFEVVIMIESVTEEMHGSD
jgi:hypothetical protein